MNVPVHLFMPCFSKPVELVGRGSRQLFAVWAHSPIFSAVSIEKHRNVRKTAANPVGREFIFFFASFLLSYSSSFALIMIVLGNEVWFISSL